ncbi:MAG: VWA domain-containing protein [Bacteroidota bacterium]
MNAKTIILILFAFIIAIAVSYFQNLYKNSHKRKFHYLLFILRTISIFVILLLLINPKIKHRILEDSKPVLSILVDNSTSIKHAKQDSMVISITDKIKNDKDIHKKFDITYFGFGEKIEIQDKFDFSDEQTDIYNALSELDKLHKGKTGATILISDGNQNYGKNYSFYQSLQSPVFPIVIGDTVKYADLSISDLNVNSYTYVGHQFPVEVFIQYQGVETVNPTLRVYNKNKVVFNQKIELSQKNNSEHITFDLPAPAKGKHFYKAVISSILNEKNKNNNITNFSIEVLDEKTNILLVHDVIHPDIAFWKRTVESNEQRKLTVSNISDFNKNITDYNFIILYQPNTKFKNILQQIQEQKINFIIQTGTHTDWDFLNRNQSYFSKQYLQKTEDINPVFNENFLTFQAEDIGFKNLPPLKNIFGKVKMKIPSENLLLQGVKNIKTENPLLVTFKKKNQKGVALFGEDIYKWRFYSYTLNSSFNIIDNYTNNLFQYLQTNKNRKRLNVNCQPFYYSNQNINITAQFYDANYNFDKKTPLEIEYFSDSTDTKVHPLILKNNTFEANLKDLIPGTYNFNVYTKDGKHQFKGKFSILEFSVEQQKLQANKEDLQNLANNSNGKLFISNQSQSLINYLVNSKDFPSVQKENIKTNSLINWKWLLVLIILSLASEWFVRKYNGLI